ncbi:hypothetical protein ACFO0S_03585 [Chryseomicrobium palamuruense]|uniref:Uncharacterized protein n=1 Tax=Chryseomicrobium palamuruense TaxID=682973 RepID=A0ABV8US75_9BACL
MPRSILRLSFHSKRHQESCLTIEIELCSARQARKYLKNGTLLLCEVSYDLFLITDRKLTQQEIANLPLDQILATYEKGIGYMTRRPVRK